MTKILVVGDVHAETHDLDDCDALLRLVRDVSLGQQVDSVLFMGDQHNDHDTVSVRVQSFWREWFHRLGERAQVIALVGNHDRADPQRSHPHAMEVYRARVVDSPVTIAPGVGAMPYYSDTALLVKEENKASVANGWKHLFCHGTFLGARYENGFFAKDAVDVALLKTPKITSGHIHSPQRVGGRVTFVGGPRWRTASDASVANRAIWVYTFDGEGNVVKMEPFRTDVAVRRIYVLEDRPDAPADLPCQGDLDMMARAQVRVKVYGPTPDYVRTREAELRARWGARTQGFPDRQVRSEVTEADGLPAAFEKFSANFVPPNGTDRAALVEAVSQRVSWA